jgi:hypothetical protein
VNDDPNYDEITPGVRKLVRFLRDAGFTTIDSGDGVTNVEAGMEGATEMPHVHIATTHRAMVVEAHRLQNAMDKVCPAGACQIQAMYDPLDGIATLSVFGVTDKDLNL